MHYENSHQSCVCVCVCVCVYVLVYFLFPCWQGDSIYSVGSWLCELVGRYLSMFVQDFCCYVCVVDRLYTYYL